MTTWVATTLAAVVAYLLVAAQLMRGATTRKRVRWNPGGGPHRGPLVYVVRARGTDRVKVGMTTRTVDERVGGWESGVPEGIELVGVVTVGDQHEAYRIEARIHRALKRRGCHIGKEWFRLPAGEGWWRDVIEEVVG